MRFMSLSHVESPSLKVLLFRRPSGGCRRPTVIKVDTGRSLRRPEGVTKGIRSGYQTEYKWKFNGEKYVVFLLDLFEGESE